MVRQVTKYSVFLEDVPSENTIYPTNFKTGIRFLSAKGKEFKQRASVSFFEAKLPKFPMVPLVVETVAYWRTMRRADISNFNKPIGDALKSSGLIEDDWILLFRNMDFLYPDDPRRDLTKFPKGLQGFMVTLYELESEPIQTAVFAKQSPKAKRT